MPHLHTHPKQSQNVLLKQGHDNRSVTPKISDFGLSVILSKLESHMTDMYQVTLPIPHAARALIEGISSFEDLLPFNKKIKSHVFSRFPKAP
jgi:hypothetical protein